MKKFLGLFLLLQAPLLMALNIDASKIEYEQKLGAPLPAAANFLDEEGVAHPLGTYLEKKPTLLVFYYSTCPNLCDLVINGMIRSLREMPQKLGRDFNLLAISIDPNETNQSLQARKALFQKRYLEGAMADAHFLRGSQANIETVTQAVGFHYTYDPEQKQYAHPSGILVINSKGQAFQYFLGITYDSAQLSQAIVAARTEERGSLAQKILLLCYQYDPLRGSWGSFIMSSMRIFSAALILILLLAVFYLQRKRRPYV